MKKIIAPIGLPGSGKSTFIREDRGHLGGTGGTLTSVIVSGDDLRLMFNGGIYSYTYTDTTALIRSMIPMINHLHDYYDVVYADEYYMTYNKAARANLRARVSPNVMIEFPFIDTPLSQCIYKRCTDTERESDNSRWPQVLLDMAKDFEPEDRHAK